MVQQFFTLPQARQHMREGPLCPYIDEYAALLCEQGYSHQCAGWQVQWLSNFSRWLQRQGLHVEDIDPLRIASYLRYRRRRWRPRCGEHPILKRFLALLRSKGLLPPEAPPPLKTARQRAEEDFERYLSQERGLSRATLLNYLPIVRRFLTERFGQNPLRFNQLLARDITEYVQRHAHDLCPKRTGLMVTALRSFLRYLRHQGRIAADLAAAVPGVAAWRLSALPRFLPIEQIQRILESCDRQSTGGRRDYAILMLLARLGLRAGEIVALTLDDIRWDTGEISVQGKGLRQSRIPLPQEVGRALADYLQRGRPPCSSRRLFIRECAPRQGFANSKAVSTLVRRALERTGVSAPCKGAHLFRHSLATHMLRQGASLADIGDLLRHRGINTTAIYAKVDLEALRPLAQPWPGGIR
ncbi:MAG: site-specific integrase [Thermodesulfobacteriota bacterium]